MVVALLGSGTADAQKVPLGSQFQVSEGRGWTSLDFVAAYDSADDRYLVVWEAEAKVLFGRLLDGTGRPIGQQFRITSDGESPGWGDVSVAYASETNQFLVAWRNCAGGTCAIVGQRFDGAGHRVGGRTEIATGDGVHSLELAYNSIRHEYFLVRVADNVLGQRIGLDGSPLSSADLTVSDTGPGGALDAVSSAAVSYNSRRDEYLIAWDQREGEFYERRIRAQRLDGAGAQVGADDFIVTWSFFPGSGLTNVHMGDLAHDPVGDAYLAVWEVWYVPWTIGSRQIRGSGDLVPCCPASEIGPGGAPVNLGGNQGWSDPSVSFDRADGAFYEAATFDLESSRDFDTEVFAGGQPVSTFGRGSPQHDAGASQIIYNPRRDEHLVLFMGNDEARTTTDLAVNKLFARRLGSPQAPSADRRPPGLTLTAKRLQRIVRQRGLVLRVACDEACRVSASARIALPGATRSIALRRVRRSLKAGARTKLRLKTSKRTLGTLRRAFKRRHRLGVRLTVTATDPSGNRTAAKRKLRARR
jgi:hypothetical protein